MKNNFADWIEVKVTDDFQKFNIPVIGYDEYYGRIGEVIFNGTRLEFVDAQKDDCHITYWMPFPYPPKEKQ